MSDSAPQASASVQEKFYDEQATFGSNVNKEAGGDVNLSFVDHFSLQKPSSSLRFRGANVQIYDMPDSQFVLEQQKESTDNQDENSKPTIRIAAKRIATTPFSLIFLRSTYSLSSLLMVMFLFVFCFNIVLSLFVSIPSLAGSTTGGSIKMTQLVSALLAIPLLVHGMASLMAMGVAFVGDVWKGGPLLRSATGLSSLWSEWSFFILFLGIPSITITITLFAGDENWWETSIKVWMVCIFIGLVVFWFAITIRETSSCFQLLRISAMKDQNAKEEDLTLWNLLLRAVYMANVQRYDGTIDERYVVPGQDEPESGYSLSSEYEPVATHKSLYSRFLEQSWLSHEKYGAFVRLDSPKRLYGVNEILDVLPFETSNNWSLQGGCCTNRSRNYRKVMAAHGNGAIGESRMVHTVYCAGIGVILVSILIIAFVSWMDSGIVLKGLIAAIAILCCFLPITNDARYQLGLYRQLQGKNGGENEDIDSEDATLFQIWESIRITQPRPWYCYFRFSLSLIFLFFWPFIGFFATENWKMGLLFLVVGFVPLVRYYLDPFVILKEMGPLRDINLPKNTSRDAGATTGSGLWAADEENHDENRVFKYRMFEIMGSISHSNSVKRWVTLFIVTVAAIFILVLGAASDEELTPNNRPELFFVEDFEYKPQPHLPYPSCEVAKSENFADPMKGLQNYALFSALTYEWKNVTESVFEQWYGPGAVVDEEDRVIEYRKKMDNVNVPVWFKLFTFPSHPGTGLVAIRGSETNWDWLVNVQLWASSALAWAISGIIPFGWLFNPVLDDLVAVVDTLVAKNIEEVSYYKVVTEFVNWLLDENGGNFTDLRVTGPSLGGGMAIIVGAQTEANAIAISGPNAVLNRHTLDPPVTLEDLNTKTLDVIPDRDIIANIGGLSRVFQRVECTAGMNSLLGCHSMWRSVCELSYSCGTVGLAVFCRCTNDFGYPKPERIGNRTFEEACPIVEDN